MTELTITELKVFTPAKDFEVSKAFYRQVGFELTEAYGGDVDCRLGGMVFRLQNYYAKDWAENFMMLIHVPDALAWFAHMKQIADSKRFAGVRVKEIEDVDGATLFHVWDPSGVLLIFIQVG